MDSSNTIRLKIINMSLCIILSAFVFLAVYLAFGIHPTDIGLSYVAGVIFTSVILKKLDIL